MGTLSGFAYLPPKSTYEAAELALRADLVRGLVTRIGMLCASEEDADGGADDAWDGLATVSLPARAETAWVGPITVSDYRFPDDEEGADGSARLKELLGIEVRMKQLRFVKFYRRQAQDIGCTFSK